MTIKVLLLALALTISQPHLLKASRSPLISAVQQETKEKVNGVVKDQVGPIPGASVFIKGTSSGAATNSNGEFTLFVPKGATIVISSIGYAQKEIKYNGEKELIIELETDNTLLDEVQVIAYGATKKATVTGALSSVKSEEIIKSPVGNIANALSGKVPGLSSVQTSGQPGADGAAIYVRGVGSLNQGLSTPLCLVDGVERSFNQIDANEIDDITVLKDASATAVFGVRGANGVILITTKRGSKGKAKISFSSNLGIQMPTRIPKFANSYEYVEAYRTAERRDGVTPENFTFTDADLEAFKSRENPILYSDTDWTDLLIKKAAIQHQHNINISGGTDRVKYFASVGAYTQNGLFNTFDTDEHSTGFKFKRLNYRVNMDVKVTNTTTAKINLGGRLTNRREPNYNNGTTSNVKYLFRDVYFSVPFSGPGIIDDKWVVLDPKQFGRFGLVYDGLHSYYGKGYNTNENNAISFDFTLSQNLDILTKGLKLHIKGSYNSSVGTYKRREGRAAKYEAFLANDGSTQYKKIQEKTTLGYSDNSGQSRDWYLEGAFNYKRKFGNHHVSALAMYNQSMKYYYGGGFLGIPRAYVGLVGRATYDYNTKYLVDLSVGYNGSENFAKGQRFGLFPAGSLGWIASEEKFFDFMKPVVSYLKFRASYGIVGNDRGGGRFLYLPNSYILKTGAYGFGSSTNYVVNGSKESKIGNPNVTWETAAKQNYGIDLHLFEGRLKTSFDYFMEHRKDILASRKINPNYLGVQLPIANIGKVDNHGYEFTLKWSDKVKDVRYSLGTGWAYAKNKIIYMDEVPQPYKWMEKTGRPVGQQFGYKTDGFFTEQDVIDYETNKGTEGGIPLHGASFTPSAGDVKYKDLNGDNVINEKDIAAIGYPMYPLLTGNFNASISWMGLDFSMVWSAAFKTSRLLSEMYRQPFGSTGQDSIMKYMIDDAWTPEKGNSAKAPGLSLSKSTANNYMDSDLWLRDASYIRLKNVELGYSLPKKWIKSSGLSNLRLSITGYNLLTFDKMHYCDPETNPNGEAYPLIRVVNFGVKAVF